MDLRLFHVLAIVCNTGRGRQILYDIAYMWNLKKKKMIHMNLLTKQK